MNNNKKHISNFFALIKRQRFKILYSLVISLVINFVCYLINNCPYPYWDEINKISNLEYLIRNISSPKIDVDDVLFINVGYDKQIADYIFDNGNSKGNIAVTDRAKLIKFLKIAEKANYKYIFLDIRFEKGVYTPLDSILAFQINKMQNLSYSNHSDIISNSIFDENKAVINDYFTTITSTNFSRYQFLQNGKESVPLRIYLATHPNSGTIEKHGIFYTCEGSLCQNSPLMNIPENFENIYEGTGNPNYVHLGPDIFDPEEEITDEDIQSALDGKIVIIGDFISDIHDTYTGPQPGSYLVYLAYKVLDNGKHFIPCVYIVLMFLFYFVISIFIFNKKSIWNLIPYIKRSESNTLRFVLSFTGYGTVLSLITILMYLLFRVTNNIFIPTVVFSILSIIISNKKS